MSLKAYPIAEGNHDNVHYIVRDKQNIIFKLCAFPETGKIYIMSSSCKINPIYIDHSILYREMKLKLEKWDLKLIGKPREMFNLKFENTAHLMESDYYKESIKKVVPIEKCNCTCTRTEQCGYCTSKNLVLVNY